MGSHVLQTSWKLRRCNFTGLQKVSATVTNGFRCIEAPSHGKALSHIASEYLLNVEYHPELRIYMQHLLLPTWGGCGQMEEFGPSPGIQDWRWEGWGRKSAHSLLLEPSCSSRLCKERYHRRLTPPKLNSL